METELLFLIPRQLHRHPHFSACPLELCDTSEHSAQEGAEEALLSPVPASEGGTCSLSPGCLSPRERQECGSPAAL